MSLSFRIVKQPLLYMKPKCLIIRENSKFINPLLFVLLFPEY